VSFHAAAPPQVSLRPRPKQEFCAALKIPHLRTVEVSVELNLQARSKQMRNFNTLSDAIDALTQFGYVFIASNATPAGVKYGFSKSAGKRIKSAVITAARGTYRIQYV
jgi:hypothetical protein